MAKRKTFNTPPFTANFARDMMKAKAVGDGDPKFSATVVLPSEHPFWKTLEKQLKAALVEKFGKVPSTIKFWPIREGSEVDYIEDGMKFMAAKRYVEDGPPQIVDADREDIIDPSQVYSGMLCRISYHVGAWFNQGTNGRGASVYLDNVQKLKDGEPIGRTKSKAVDDFADWVDEDEDSDEDSALG